MLSAEGGRSDPSVTVQIHRAARHTGGVAGQCCSRVDRKQDVSDANIKTGQKPFKGKMKEHYRWSC